MFDIFSLVDGADPSASRKANVGVSAKDDRKITLDEWKRARHMITGYNFVACKKGNKTPEQVARRTQLPL